MTDPNVTFKWGLLVVQCAKELGAAPDLPAPYIDCEVIPPLDGSPDRVFVWFIVQRKSLVDRFRAQALVFATRRLRELLVSRGFPPQAADTLRTDVTSQEAIDAGGGRFYYFR
jgi:hypothetical protein